MRISLDGRRVLVGGACSGIGEVTARELAEGGARIACLARSKDKVEALADEIGGVALAADVAGVQLLAPSPTAAPTSGAGFWT
jgi:NADP-dependent 3-hydroxy acid dehydrogenase YdfG